MDFMTIAGLLAGAGTVYFVMSEGNILNLMFNWVAFILVFGGTVSATLISYSWGILKYVPTSIKLMFYSREHTDENRQELIEKIAALAEKARRESIESLQRDVNISDDPFTAYALQMVIDGIEYDVIRENLEKRTFFTHQHHQKINGVFRTMGTYSPIFGLLGTLIGVVQVLRNLSDPSSMGASMAIAITTTFYGIFAANFLFLPAAIKLGELNENETLRMQIITEGTLSISRGELPAMVRKKLNSFLLSRLSAAGRTSAQ